ncbi:MAG: FAD-binding protein, partial [Acidimicrobiia bacterium]
TTNPLESTGDGLAMALRAGVACADVEFMQFHPTALAVAKMPKPLLTEALRGHGALLRDMKGERFIDELQPRDVVSRAETAVMIEQETDHVWLDATGLEEFADRFPTLANELTAVGLDPAKDWLPVAPAAHYHCGGVVTDIDGATSLPGLWAAGEVACTGVHGANRLASNSLLEGMVFGPRVIEALEDGVSGPRPTGAMRAVLLGDAIPSGVIGGILVQLPEVSEQRVSGDAASLRDQLQRVMTAKAGVLRDHDSLESATGLARAVEAASEAPTTSAEVEVRNLGSVAAAIAATGLMRSESRGCHTRSDYPESNAALRVRLIVSGTPH